jgi:hypothetical protein
MLLKTLSMASADAFLEIPTSEATASIRSALVMEKSSKSKGDSGGEHDERKKITCLDLP